MCLREIGFLGVFLVRRRVGRVGGVDGVGEDVRSGVSCRGCGVGAVDDVEFGASGARSHRLVASVGGRCRGAACGDVALRGGIGRPRVRGSLPGPPGRRAGLRFSPVGVNRAYSDAMCDRVVGDFLRGVGALLWRVVSRCRGRADQHHGDAEQHDRRRQRRERAGFIFNERTRGDRGFLALFDLFPVR
jgi:hypothetical protein